MYWAPVLNPDDEINMNLVYREPKNLYDDLIKDKEPRSLSTSMFSCPAVNDRIKKTFVFESGIDINFDYDFSDPERPSITQPNNDTISVNYYKHSNIIDGAYAAIGLTYVFFAEESVEALFHPPLMKPAAFSQKAAIVPGRYDISKWFRALPLEMQIWDNKGSICIKDGDPLFYLELNVPDDVFINLHRFEVTKEMLGHMASSARTANMFKRNIPLPERYKRFTETKTNKIILNSIKNNLV